MHTVAFMQWRLTFPNSVRHDEKEVIDLLDEAYHRLYSKPLVFALIPKTQKLPDSFFEIYDFTDCDKPFEINHFEQIGWYDPFPDEYQGGSNKPKREVPQDQTAFIYPGNKIEKGYVPFQMYIPNKIIIFKMMRCAAFVKEEADANGYADDLCGSFE